MNYSVKSKGWVWPQLIRGNLVKRYKRFMADVTLENGEIVTAHCPNSGSMKGCCEPGRLVYLSYHNNPKRKLKYTWELIQMPSSLVGINTQIPNKLVEKSIETGVLPEFKYYDNITGGTAIFSGIPFPAQCHIAIIVYTGRYIYFYC